MKLFVAQISEKFPPLKNPQVNPLNAELNPICHLLALLGVHHFLHVSRIRVKEELLNEMVLVVGKMAPY
jgi:hypothetical protein